jgi:hypothetical protein
VSATFVRRAGLLVGLLALGSHGSAQQAPTPAPVDVRSEGEGEPERSNEVALVLAATRERDEEGETSFTIGGEYGRRLSHRFSVVGELEYVSGPDSWVFAAPLVFQAVGGLKLFGGPGFERRLVESEHAEEEAEAPATDGARENLFLWRVGTSYAWEFARRYVVSPTVYVDFVKAQSEWTRAFVLGATFGVAF